MKELRDYFTEYKNIKTEDISKVGAVKDSDHYYCELTNGDIIVASGFDVFNKIGKG